MRDAKPIIKTKEMSINLVDHAFVINQDDSYCFILKSRNTHFEIKWKRENEFNFNE